MNKKVFKILLVLLLIPLIIDKVYALTAKNDKSGYEMVIEDDANLLTEQEIHFLEDQIYELTEYGNIVFKSTINNYSSTSEYAKNYYYNLFSNDSGTMFLIDMKNREIYIYSEGENYNIITSNKAYVITDNVFRYASSKEYYKCASNAFSQIKTLLDGGKILEPMRYTSNIVISITLASFITFMIAVFSSKTRKVKGNELMNYCNKEFEMNDFNASKTGTHMVYSPVSDNSSDGSSHSSGGGHSFGGGGGGGHSSGGGGGHRF